MILFANFSAKKFRARFLDIFSVFIVNRFGDINLTIRVSNYKVKLIIQIYSLVLADKMPTKFFFGLKHKNLTFVIQIYLKKQWK